MQSVGVLSRLVERCEGDADNNLKQITAGMIAFL